MRMTSWILLLLLAATPAAAQELSADETGGPVLCDLYHGVEDGAARSGAFYTNFWPGGEVPYVFAAGSNIVIRSRVRTDITFIPGTPSRLQSPTGFPAAVVGVGDIIRVNGSQNNDGINMTVTARRDFNTVGAMEIDVTPTFPLTAESPTGSAVLIFRNEGVSTDRRNLMLAAMAEWEAVANIDFKPRTTENDWVLVSADTVNTVNGNVGFQGGLQTIKISNWGNAITLQHELGHCLGLKHEHQRPDRNTYVSINTNIIQAGSGGNFTLDNGITMYPDQTYDFGSIMHYHRNAFLAAGQTGPVITVLSPWNTEWQNLIGNAVEMSHWDRKTMSLMYPESNWRFLHKQTASATNNGQFLTPWDDFDTALAGTPTGGRLIITHPGSYVEPGVYSKRMVWEAPQGGVTISAN